MRAQHWVIMGVSGSGKSTVGAGVAAAGGFAFIDGDDLHPAANVAKMAGGTPLSDADRAPWLARVGEAFADADRPTVIACSALRRAYRDQIRAAAGQPVGFLHLHGSRAVLAARLAARKGHFMPPGLLDDQLATLEQLEAEEAGTVLNIDQPAEALIAAALQATRP